MTSNANNKSPKSTGGAFAILGALLVALGLGLGIRYAFLDKGPIEPLKIEVKIGGPFDLSDHTGKTVTDESYRGRYLLVYFGYIYCPDVCPTGLQTITEALNKLGDKAQAVQPIFVSVDPERDTVAQMAAYVKSFHPSLIGLTGTPEQVMAMARAYRVYYAKVRKEGAAANEYLVDHSAVIYLMGPDGRYIQHFSHSVEAEEMAKALERHLDK
jgi:cytochrome oxidase Cu insertion factor (SCO1/SenC/PrrC family)